MRSPPSPVFVSNETLGLSNLLDAPLFPDSSPRAVNHESRGQEEEEEKEEVARCCVPSPTPLHPLLSLTKLEREVETL